MRQPDTENHLDSLILLALFAIALFGSPLIALWSTRGIPWYAIYLWWLLVIALGAVVQQRRKRHEP